MAWYTDVTHEIKPITSGYRLALAYNLIHTTTSLRPALSNPESSVQELRRILQAWTDDNGRGAPSKIIYLLQHKYSQANLRASALKGVDANKVGILAMLTKEHGFHLGLASVVCSLNGYADDEGRRHRNRWNDSSSSESDVDFAEIEEREMTVEDFVDLDGNLISKNLPLAAEEDEEEGEGGPCETIPAELASIVEDGPADSQEYEGYLGNGAGSLSRCYRRTVLVIWPNYSNFTIQYGENNVDRACLTLANVSHEVPSRDDVALADFILGLAAKAPAKAAQSTCHAACLWKDLALWKRAIATCSPLCKGLAVLDKHEAALNAISSFGFENVQSSLEALLKDDLRNAERLAFLDALEVWVPSQNSPELSASALVWVKTARESVITSLHTPRAQDVDAFVSLALQQGGITFLTNTIIPQITAVASPDFLRLLCVKAYDESRFVDPPEIKSQILSDIMSNAISRTQFTKYTKPAHQSTYNYGYTTHQKAEPNSNFLNAGRFFQACVGRFDALVGLLAVQVTDMRHLASADVHKHVKEVLLPILEVIATRVVAGAPPPTSTSNLFRLVVDAYIEIVTESPNGTTRGSIRSLIRAAALPEGAELLAIHVMPKFEDLTLPDTVVRGFIEELRAHANRINFPPGYSGPTIPTLVTTLCKKYARTVDPSSAQVIKNALEFCLGINELEGGTILMQRAVEPNRWNVQHVANLIPLIPDIRRLSQQYNVPHPGFSFVLQAIVLAWISKVLGPKPEDKSSAHLAPLASWKCNCGDCTTVKTFLRDSSQETKYLDRFGAPRCRHLEEHLAMYAKAACTWRVVTSTPRAMTLTKSPSMFGLAKWKAQQLKGEIILKAISGSDAELQRILGSHYASIVAIIRGRAPADQVASTENAVAGSSRAASTTAEGQPQTKKRRVVDPKDIIDLT